MRVTSWVGSIPAHGEACCILSKVICEPNWRGALAYNLPGHW